MESSNPPKNDWRSWDGTSGNLRITNHRGEYEYDVRKIENGFALKLTNGKMPSTYTIRDIGNRWACDCPDAKFRGATCKHIKAIEEIPAVSNEVATTNQPTDLSKIEKVLIRGDLSVLSESERIAYYRQVCEVTGLNWATKPFEYLDLGTGKQKKLVLYATKSCTDQLRQLHNISVVDMDVKPAHGVFIVKTKVRDNTGREGIGTGVVPLEVEDGEWTDNPKTGKRFFRGNGKWRQLKGEELANAMMKAETKSLRRATLAFCGLGMIDETEVDIIPDAQVVPTKQIEHQSEPPQSQQPQQPATNPQQLFDDLLMSLDIAESLQRISEIWNSDERKSLPKEWGNKVWDHVRETAFEKFGMEWNGQKWIQVRGVA